MPENDALAIVQEYIACINRRDADGMMALMTEDYVFIDALGHRLQNREAVRQAWTAYFSLFPDYQVAVEKYLAQDDFIAAFGTAEGTLAIDGKLTPANHWQIPAAWLAIVRGSLIAQWRVYADNEPVRQIMAKRGR